MLIILNKWAVVYINSISSNVIMEITLIRELFNVMFSGLKAVTLNNT